MEETWKVLDFAPRYLISDHGNIKNNEGREIKQWCSNKGKWGYKQIQLHVNGKRVVYRIHRLVAWAFLGMDIDNPKSIPMHMDDNPKNNHVSNIKVGDYYTNLNDMKSKGRTAVGERNGANKITEAQAIEILSKKNTGASTVALGKQYNIGHGSINAIWNRKTWKHLKTPD